MDITRLKREYKKSVEARKALEDQVASNDVDKARAVSAATVPLQLELMSMKLSLDGAHKTGTELHARLLKLKDDDDKEIEALKLRLAEVEGERDGWKLQAEQAQPSVDLATEQVADMVKLLDKIRDRMKRKDLEDERAILNRRMLGGAVPGQRSRP